MTTHEAFVAAVANAACTRLEPAERELCQSVKLVYGAGRNGILGVTYFNRWKKGQEHAHPFVEVSAFSHGQHHWIELADSVIHELGHVLAGPLAGHEKAWKEACHRLGLRRARASGVPRSGLARFEPDLRLALAALEKPDEGQPVASLGLGGLAGLFDGLGGKRPTCQVGLGTKGGKSHGPGSGRYRLWECACQPKPVKARVASDAFRAVCLHCNTPFELRLGKE